MRIAICRSLPQWIISSSRAAYHPHTETIYLRWDCLWALPHELCHWIIHKLLGNRQKLHNLLDARPSRENKCL
jgi:hypothetical protein